MKLYLALDIRALDPKDDRLETARRAWTGPLLPVGSEVIVDLGESVMLRTIVSGHSTMLSPADQVESESIDMQLEFAPRVSVAMTEHGGAEAVAWMLTKGGWKLPE